MSPVESKEYGIIDEVVRDHRQTAEDKDKK
jgi:hypothetical protein